MPDRCSFCRHVPLLGCAVNHEKIDQICKKNSEKKLCSGEIILGFFVLIVIAILMSCQPAKDGVTPQPHSVSNLK